MLMTIQYYRQIKLLQKYLGYVIDSKLYVHVAGAWTGNGGGGELQEGVKGCGRGSEVTGLAGLSPTFLS